MSAAYLQLPAVGDLLAGKYRLSGVLGRGGMGVVFDGRHELLGRAVAVKVLAPEVLDSTEAIARFLNEARAAARISSDNVVQVLDVGVLDNGLPFMVMERLEGKDLGQLLKEGGPQSVSVVVDLLMEAIEGVGHAHLEGIIHRDLKPQNLFLALRSDRTTIVKVLDFGVSKLLHIDGAGPEKGSVTSTRAVLGSPRYMPPEQLRSSKKIDTRADVWSLGVIAYELLTNDVPFKGENLVDFFIEIQEREPRPLYELRPDVPPALEQVIRDCLRREADERHANVFALGRALTPFGSARAGASLERLTAYLASKGLSFEAIGSAVLTPPPRTPPPAPQQAAPAFTPGQGTSPPAVTPQLAPMQPATAPSPPPIGSPPPEGSAAPWSSTRAASPRPGPRHGVLFAALGGVLLLGGIAATMLVLHQRRPPAAASEQEDEEEEDDDTAPPAPTGTASATFPARARPPQEPHQAHRPPPLRPVVEKPAEKAPEKPAEKVEEKRPPPPPPPTPSASAKSPLSMPPL